MKVENLNTNHKKAIKNVKNAQDNILFPHKINCNVWISVLKNKEQINPNIKSMANKYQKTKKSVHLKGLKEK